jgi:hypothetical protein
MRYLFSLIAAAGLLLPGAALAQRVNLGGWVGRVDTANSTITVRTLGNPRTLPVAPNAVIRLNGAPSRLDQLPLNSSINIVAEPNPNGVLQVTQIVAGTDIRQPAASAPPGAIVRGTLVGVNIPDNTVSLQTESGIHVYSLGNAPIMVNGVTGSIRNLQLGEMIQLDRSLPTAASTDYVTQMVHVLPAARRPIASPARPAYSRTGTRRPIARRAVRSASGTMTGTTAAGTMVGSYAGKVVHGTIRSRTLAYRSHYASRHSTRRHRRHYRRHRRRMVHRSRARSHRRRRHMASSMSAVPNTGIVAATGRGGVAPAPRAATATATSGTAVPGAVSTAPAVVAPSPAYVYGTGGTYVPPFSGVVSSTTPTTGAVANPAATTTPNARQQSPLTGAAPATILPPQNQAAAAANAAAAGVPNPRFQAIPPGSTLGTGVATPGIPNARFQGLSPVVPQPTAPRPAPVIRH